MIKFPKYKAVSLLELLVSLTVICVLLGMSFMAYNDATDRQNVSNSVKQLGFAINKARSYAQTKGYPTQVIITSGQSTYSIKANNVEITNSSYNDAMSGVLPSGTKVVTKGCSNDIYFYIDGTPLTNTNPKTVMSSDCIIKVGIDNRTYKTLTINGQSGEVTYE